jgi:hypothetical protein
VAAPYYAALAWEFVPGTDEELAKAADAAISEALENYETAVFLDRLVFVPLQNVNQQNELYGVMRYLASKLYYPNLRYALSPPLVVGSSWNGWAPNNRWEAVKAVETGHDIPEKPE